PIVTTASGKGVVVETDPLAAGPIGPFGSPTANTVLGESDVVVAVGTKLAPQDTVEAHPALVDPSRQTLIQIDIEPLNVGWTFPVDVPRAHPRSLDILPGERLRRCRADLTG